VAPCPREAKIGLKLTAQGRAESLLETDTVEKASFRRRMEFFKTAGASHERRREGPRRLKAIFVFVIVLQGLSAAEITNDRPSGNFRRLAIFDFFNSIDPKETLTFDI
jgi:hypothetical protein